MNILKCARVLAVVACLALVAPGAVLAAHSYDTAQDAKKMSTSKKESGKKASDKQASAKKQSAKKEATKKQKRAAQ